MCFSATASFASSTVLGTLGAAAILKTKNRRLMAFSAIPFIFAFQQLIEGSLWLALKNPVSTAVVPLTYAFQFFALLWWPIYIPFVAYGVEDSRWRKRIIMFLGLVGLGVGSALYLFFLQNPATAHINGRCINYPLDVPNSAWYLGLYVLAVVGPGAATSRGIMRLFCALIFIFGIFAWINYRVNFLSVWCFFAAIVSLVIFVYDADPHLSFVKRFVRL